MSEQLPRLGYVSYFVLDLKRSLSFYVEQLGMQEQARIPLANGLQEVILGFGAGRNSPGIILMHHEKREKPYERGDGFSRIVVEVAELRALVQKLADQGTKVVVAPTTVENLNLTYALIRDPDGYIIELLERA